MPQTDFCNTIEVGADVGATLMAEDETLIG